MSTRVPQLLDHLAALSWRLLVVFALLGFFAYLLAQLQFVVLSLFLALLGVAVLSPIRALLERRGIDHALAVWVALLFSVLAFLGVIAAIAIPLVISGPDLASNVSQGIDRLVNWLSEGPLHIPRSTIDQYIGYPTIWIHDNLSRIVNGVIGTTLVGITVLGSVLLSVPIMFFFLKDSRQIKRWLLHWIASEDRDRTDWVLTQSWNRFGRFIRGVAIVAAFDATFIGIGLFTLRIPLAGSLAVLTFVAAFVPFFGAVTAGAAAVLVALVAHGVTDALLVLGIVIAVQQLEGHVVSPFVVGRSVDLHPVSIILAVAIGGIMGAVVAVPAMAFALGIANEMRSPHRGGDNQA